MQQQGTLFSWKDDRGFGFIRPDGGGPELFVHFSAFPKGVRPAGGERVRFEVGRDRRSRPQAQAVEIMGLDGVLAAVPRSVKIAGGVALGFFALLILAVAGGLLPWMVAGLYLAASLITFAIYGHDKRAARHDERRIPEKTLHLLALAGGWPGALVAQWVFRHKSRKTAFQVVFWGATAANLLVLAALLSPQGQGLLARLGG